MIRAALLGAMLSGLPAVAEDIPTLFRGGAPGVTLSGSLLLAPSPGAPALAIVSGSGLQDKDFTHQGQQIFRRLAEKLAGQGISTLRYDDRGYGGSTGDPQITMADEAADAAAALDHLCGQIGIDPFRVGLIGHSSGGIAVTRALGDRNGTGIAVLLASPTTNGEEVLLWQTAANLKAAGMSDATVAQNNSQVRRLIAATLSSDQELLDTTRQIGAEVGADLQWMRLQVAIFGAPWMRDFLKFNPVPSLSALSGPVLALYGERDLRVEPQKNADLARGALDGNPQSDVRIVPGTAHLMQKAARLNHLADAGPAPSDAVVRIIAEWIKAQPPLRETPCRSVQ